MLMDSQKKRKKKKKKVKMLVPVKKFVGLANKSGNWLLKKNWGFEALNMQFKFELYHWILYIISITNMQI